MVNRFSDYVNSFMHTPQLTDKDKPLWADCNALYPVAKRTKDCFSELS
jgi:hypothetical protein